MTPDQLQSVIEEISDWTLEARRDYIANLARMSIEDAEQVKDGLKKVWEEKKRMNEQRTHKEAA